MKIFGKREDIIFSILLYGFLSTGESKTKTFFFGFAFSAPQIAGGLWTKKNDLKTTRLFFFTKPCGWQQL